MSAVPLSRLKKGAVVHIDSIAPNPVFGDLDTLVTRRLADLGFSSGMPLQVIAVGGLGEARLRYVWVTNLNFPCVRKRPGRLCVVSLRPFKAV